DVVAPNAEAVDQEGPRIEDNRVVYAEGTKRNYDVLAKAGLMGISLPRRYNGLNFPYVPFIMTTEIISRADTGFSTIWSLQDCAETINAFADEAIKDKFLPRIYEGATCSMDLTEPDAGSDLQAVRLKATYDESAGCWRLNGVKRFITNGGADLHLVLARSEEGTTDGRGLSYFLYDRQDGGLTVRRLENKMGIKGSPTAELVFRDAPAHIIGERRFGLIKYVMTLMNDARLGVGSQSVGLSEAACREAEAYAAERVQFGQPVAAFPAVRDLLMVMRARTDATRSLLYETSRMVDFCKLYEGRTLQPEERTFYKWAQRSADMLTPLLKLSASEFANRNAYDCIQVHGGSGFMKEYACERLYRDARILSIYEGTSQLQVVAAQKGLSNGACLAKIGEYDSRPLHAALEPLRAMLREAVEDFKVLAALPNPVECGYDFKRMQTDVVAAIIMGYLLLLDCDRQLNGDTSCSRSFMPSARYMAAYARAEAARSLQMAKAYSM
ncbi:MAG: acyl-CoA dehydrogenase family protein, partial [Bacteroidales bacterium]|nr:acyl-CoA dehydrogenase family protein [Bacteroidales bacterium]